MRLPGLTGIGKLGGRDADGFHHVMIKPGYRSVFSDLEEVYLIFNSDRVFYVTISERKQSGKKTWVKFLEDGVSEEQPKHKDVVIAIVEVEEDAAASDAATLAGFKVMHNNELLGEVEVVFHNGAQDVLQIVDSSGIEILIPLVDHYVQSVQADSQSVILHNAEELIVFYRNEAKP